jgi:hypothetical protein
MEEALRMFNKMLAWDVASWTTKLRGFAMDGCGNEAYK